MMFISLSASRIWFSFVMMSSVEAEVVRFGTTGGVWYSSTSLLEFDTRTAVLVEPVVNDKDSERIEPSVSIPL